MAYESTKPESESYGGRLYAELRKVSGYDVILAKLSYDAIQRLKKADRAETVKLFYGSSYELLQQIKAKEPGEVAAYLVEELQRARQAAVMIAGMSF